MGDSCATFRPMLGRWAEGETSPEEALRLARHLPDCTACRIVLARETRLASMLAGLEDPIAVEEGFLRGVMGSLPAGSPPTARRRTKLRLAGLGGSLVLVGACAWRCAWLLAGGASPELLTWPGIPRLESLLETLGGVAGVVWMVLDRVSTGALVEVPLFHIDARIGIAAVLPALAAALTASTLAMAIARARCRG